MSTNEQVPVSLARTVALNNYLQRTGRLTSLSWEESAAGQEHTPTWTCICKIDGRRYGEGTGMNKQAAREVASRLTLDALISEEQDRRA